MSRFVLAVLALVVTLAGAVSSSGCTPAPPRRDLGSDAAPGAYDAATGVDMSIDPVVGRPCGPGMYCPCGYFCPAGTCEVADFHPPCDMR